MRSQPDKWDPKVTAIQEAKDLNTLSLDELMGSLITHELTLQHRTKDELKKKKSIALKAAMEDLDEPSSDEAIKDEQLGMLVRKFKKYMGRRNRFNKRNPRKQETSDEKDRDINKTRTRRSLVINVKNLVM